MRLTKTDLGASWSCLRSYLNQLSLDFRLRFATVSSSRTTHPQRQRDDLKRCRQTAHYFAIEFDRYFLVLFHRAGHNLFGQRMIHFIHAQVSAEIKPGRIAENSKGTRFADADHIKPAII